MKLKPKEMLSVFLAFFRISALTFGGGYVIVPLIKKEFVDKRGLLSDEEMLDIIALAQSSPGAVAINTSALVGKRLGGVAGVLLALLGAVLPPFIILSVISLFYSAFIANEIVANVLLGMRAGVTAVIADIVITMALPMLKKRSPLPYIIIPLSFASIFFFKINPLFVILASIAVGIIALLVSERRHKA